MTVAVVYFMVTVYQLSNSNRVEDKYKYKLWVWAVFLYDLKKP